jgi:hypothetical protein
MEDELHLAGESTTQILPQYAETSPVRLVCSIAP